MKHRRVFLGFAVLLCAAAIFMGCPTDAGDDGEDINYGTGEPGELNVTVTSAGSETKYYSLATGAEVTDADAIASKAWDIAFQRSRMIYTNSGDTAVAAGSGGLGGVWYTDKTDFDDVGSTDAVPISWENTEYLDFTTDTTKYLSGMGAPAPSRLNVMTYWGFKSGTGTSADPYTSYAQADFEDASKWVPYGYNKKNYVSMTAMTGPNGAEFALSNQVYIVKHGDGAKYSKIQITEYTSRSAAPTADPPVLAADILKVKYQNF
jgi:hypothetical protein